MLVLLWISAALLPCIASNAIFPTERVGARSQDIVYTIGDMSASRVKFTDKHINEALSWIQENTCINFIDSKNAPGRNIDLTYEYVRGRCAYANKKVMISECISSIYTIVHETVHSLGFYHTNNRPDWPQYIKVLPGMEDQLDREPCNATPVVGYDLGSGMHHDLYEVGVAAPLDDAFLKTMGQGVRFAFSDYHSINWLFNCSGKCTTQPPCLNGGYTHPRDCARCMCNKYYTGDFCETPLNLVKLSCEDKKVHSWELFLETNKTLRSRRILQDEFRVRRDDLWEIIEAPQDMKIQVEVLSQSGIWTALPAVACAATAVEINEGDLNLVGRMFCDDPNMGAITHNFTSKSNRVGFHAEYVEMWVNMKAKFTLLGCDAPLPTTTTTTTDAPTTTVTTTPPVPETTTTEPTTTTTQEPTESTTTSAPTTTTTETPEETTTTEPLLPTTTVTSPPEETTTDAACEY